MAVGRVAAVARVEAVGRVDTLRRRAHGSPHTDHLVQAAAVVSRSRPAHDQRPARGVPAQPQIDAAAREAIGVSRPAAQRVRPLQLCQRGASLVVPHQRRHHLVRQPLLQLMDMRQCGRVFGLCPTRSIPATWPAACSGSTGAEVSSKVAQSRQ